MKLKNNPSNDQKADASAMRQMCAKTNMDYFEASIDKCPTCSETMVPLKLAGKWNTIKLNVFKFNFTCWKGQVVHRWCGLFDLNQHK